MLLKEDYLKPVTIMKTRVGVYEEILLIIYRERGYILLAEQENLQVRLF
jgi:hypothetical protein